MSKKKVFALIDALSVYMSADNEGNKRPINLPVLSIELALMQLMSLTLDSSVRTFSGHRQNYGLH